jgi:hypothetical protein
MLSADISAFFAIASALDDCRCGFYKALCRYIGTVAAIMVVQQNFQPEVAAYKYEYNNTIKIVPNGRKCFRNLFNVAFMYESLEATASTYMQLVQHLKNTID